MYAAVYTAMYATLRRFATKQAGVIRDLIERERGEDNRAYFPKDFKNLIIFRLFLETFSGFRTFRKSVIPVYA